MTRLCRVVLDPVNLSKNRYTDVIPFDSTRVLLISYSCRRCYSVYRNTQGPLPHTYEDFWEMVLQNRCPAVVMLTRLIDNYKSEEPPLSVLHIQYPEWPVHGVPKDSLAVREIFERTYHLPPGVGPIVVHCSAGIGRTGAYCTIQRILGRRNVSLDLAITVENFRSQRVRMVQSQVVVVDELEELLSGYEPEKSA